MWLSGRQRNNKKQSLQNLKWFDKTEPTSKSLWGTTGSYKTGHSLRQIPLTPVSMTICQITRNTFM